MTENTLQLLYNLLCNQQIRVGADRAEIEAVLTAKKELEDEILKL